VVEETLRIATGEKTDEQSELSSGSVAEKAHVASSQWAREWADI